MPNVHLIANAEHQQNPLVSRAIVVVMLILNVDFFPIAQNQLVILPNPPVSPVKQTTNADVALSVQPQTLASLDAE